MMGTILKENNGQHVVIIKVFGDRLDKYSPSPGSWFCIETDANGRATYTMGTGGTRTGVGRNIEMCDRHKWAVVGSISEDKVIELIKARAQCAKQNLEKR